MAIYVAAIDGMTSYEAADATSFQTSLISQEGCVLVTDTDLQVQAQGTPDMTVKVKKGSCYVLRDAHVAADNTLKFWHVVVTADTNVTITANSSGSARVDRICVKVDTGATPDATASNVATLVAVVGTPGAGAPTVPDNHLLLAQVAVADGETEIASGDITDERTFIGLVVSTLQVGTIVERVAAAGVTIDGLQIKDSRAVYGDNAPNIAPKARAYLSANQLDLVNNVYTKILLNAETYDVGGDFADYKFTAPVAGYYLVVGQISYNTTSVVLDKAYEALIYVDGAYETIGNAHASFAGTLAVTVSDIRYLTAGQYVELYARQTSGVDTVDLFGNKGATFMAVHLIST